METGSKNCGGWRLRGELPPTGTNRAGHLLLFGVAGGRYSRCVLVIGRRLPASCFGDLWGQRVLRSQKQKRAGTWACFSVIFRNWHLLCLKFYLQPSLSPSCCVTKYVGKKAPGLAGAPNLDPQGKVKGGEGLHYGAEWQG